MKALSLALSAAACSGDGPAGAEATPFSVAAPEAADGVMGGFPFSLVLRGASAEDVRVVRIANETQAFHASSDSTLLVVMPAGAASGVGVSVEAEGPRSSTRTASLNITRQAAPAVANPVAFTDSVFVDVSEVALAVALLSPSEGASPDDFVADALMIGGLLDSLQSVLNTLTPTERAQAAQLLAGLELQDLAGTAALRSPEPALAGFSEEEIGICRSTFTDALTCLRGTQQEVGRYLRQMVKWGLVAGVGFDISRIPGLQKVGWLVGGVGLVKMGATMLEMHRNVYARIFSPAIFTALGLEAPAAVTSQPMLTTNLVGAPGQPIPLPLIARTRNALNTDGANPVVSGIAVALAELAVEWNRVMSYLPRPLRVSAPALATASQRNLSFTPDLSLLRVASIAPSGFTASLSESQGRVQATVTGDAGNGADVTLTLEARATDAGSAAVTLPIRLEVGPDSLATIRDLLDGRLWNIGKEPWQLLTYIPRSSVRFRACCFGGSQSAITYTFFAPDENGTVFVTTTSGFNGNVVFYRLTSISASSFTLQRSFGNGLFGDFTTFPQ